MKVRDLRKALAALPDDFTVSIFLAGEEETATYVTRHNRTRGILITVEDGKAYENDGVLYDKFEGVEP